jgi:transposase-like protein
MANVLKMAKVQAIVELWRQGRSFRRIARELGVHRDTVSRYVRETQASPRPANLTAGAEGEGGPKPAKVTAGISGPKSQREPSCQLTLGKPEPGLSAVGLMLCQLPPLHITRVIHVYIDALERRLSRAHPAAATVPQPAGTPGPQPTPPPWGNLLALTCHKQPAHSDSAGFSPPLPGPTPHTPWIGDRVNALLVNTRGQGQTSDKWSGYQTCGLG